MFPKITCFESELKWGGHAVLEVWV